MILLRIGVAFFSSCKPFFIYLDWSLHWKGVKIEGPSFGGQFQFGLLHELIDKK